VSVSFHDGKLELDGVEEMVQEQLERVTDVLDNLPDLPPEARERARQRIKAVREKIRGRLGKLKSMDVEQIGPEMERMGDEIEKEMEGLDKELAQYGERLGRDLAQKLGKGFTKGFGPGPGAVAAGRDRDNSDDADDDDDDDEDRAATPIAPVVEADPADSVDMRAAIAGLKNIALDPGQKAQLAQLRQAADRQIAEAQRELDRLSSRLHDELGDSAAGEAEIAQQIDAISSKEAEIRKARILTWVKARNLLRKDQRKMIESAARRGH
jgi:hypothetical protein